MFGTTKTEKTKKFLLITKYSLQYQFLNLFEPNLKNVEVLFQSMKKCKFFKISFLSSTQLLATDFQLILILCYHSTILLNKNCWDGQCCNFDTHEITFKLFSSWKGALKWILPQVLKIINSALWCIIAHNSGDYHISCHSSFPFRFLDVLSKELHTSRQHSYQDRIRYTQTPAKNNNKSSRSIMY